MSRLAHVCGFLRLNVRSLLKTHERVRGLENLW
jgi:hypothetical protein